MTICLIALHLLTGDPLMIESRSVSRVYVDREMFSEGQTRIYTLDGENFFIKETVIEVAQKLGACNGEDA